MKTVLFVTASKRIKYLGINLIKKAEDLYTAKQMKDDKMGRNSMFTD